MRMWVVDTNVILAANGHHEALSPECVEACTVRLHELQQNGIVVLDDEFRILLEYQKKTDSKRGKGPGDAFLKWLLQNSSNPSRCVQVGLKEDDEGCFNEFPIQDRQREFDPADRKFLSVANAMPEKACLLQASDCKWLDWHDPLMACGIVVRFLCPDDICRFYANKYPGRAVPDL